jgi:hypothetical protein
MDDTVLLFTRNGLGDVAVGVVGGMPDIIEAMLLAGKVITL